MAVMNNSKKCHQQGGALLIFMLVVVLAGMATLFGLLDSNRMKFERDKKTALVLSEAKSALIGWSVLQANMGRLPCPEDTAQVGMSAEGTAQISCVLPAVGRLPWKTLGLGDIRDGNGDKLWYVISAGFRTSPINSASPAQLTVDGLAGAAVAVVISPGNILGAQTRPDVTSTNPPIVTGYLDLTNNDGDNTFVTNGVTTSFNDQILLVKHSELFTPITKRVLGEIKGDSAQGLVQFYNANALYPYADTNADGNVDNLATSGMPSYNGSPANLFFSNSLKTSLVNNGWMALTTYNVASDQQSVTLGLYGQTLMVAP